MCASRPSVERFISSSVLLWFVFGADAPRAPSSVSLVSKKILCTTTQLSAGFSRDEIPFTINIHENSSFIFKAHLFLFPDLCVCIKKKTTKMNNEGMLQLSLVLLTTVLPSCGW